MPALECVTSMHPDALAALDSVSLDYLGDIPPQNVVRRVSGERFVLNAWDLEPGDVVLYQATGLPGPYIQAYQTFVNPRSENASWTHVGIYAGGGIVWESFSGQGVDGRVFNTSTLGRTLMVRRFRGAGDAFRERLSDVLLESVGTQYGTRAPRVLVELLTRRAWSRFQSGDTDIGVFETSVDIVSRYRDAINSVPDHVYEPAVCSQFVERAYSVVLGTTIHPTIPLPMDFAEDKRFDDVDIRWYRVA